MGQPCLGWSMCTSACRKLKYMGMCYIAVVYCLHSLVDMYRHFRESFCLLGKVLWNAGTSVPDYQASYLTRQL
jgi:hypothetical protein